VLITCGLLGFVGYNYLLFGALSRDLKNVITPAVINYLWPITTLLFSALILRQRMTRRTMMAAAVAFAGLLVIQVARLTGGASLLDASGQACLLALGAAISWGLFSALARRAADEHGFHPLSSLVIYQAIAMITTAAIHWNQLDPMSIIARPKLLLVLVVLGVGANGIANMTWLQAIRIGGAGKTSVVAYLTPVLSLTYVAIFLGQRPQWYALIGLGAILAAITIVRTTPRPKALQLPQADAAPPPVADDVQVATARPPLAADVGAAAETPPAGQQPAATQLEGP
jgi:drug/metabolite transporter (DMT)-like permease